MTPGAGSWGVTLWMCGHVTAGAGSGGGHPVDVLLHVQDLGCVGPPFHMGPILYPQTPRVLFTSEPLIASESPASD